jgi:hypothetical protein
MNLNELWSGNDYAYYRNKGRGETFRLGAPRVKIIRTFKEQLLGNDRMSGFAEVLWCDDDGTPRTEEAWDDATSSYNDVDLVRKVRARDIAMRWEEYEDERDHYLAAKELREREHKERMEKARLEREERDRIERERRELLYNNVANTLGIPRAAIQHITDYNITLNRALIDPLVEAWKEQQLPKLQRRGTNG